MELAPHQASSAGHEGIIVSESPENAKNPSDYRPAQQDVHQQQRCQVMFVPHGTDNDRQQVNNQTEQNQQKQEKVAQSIQKPGGLRWEKGSSATSQSGCPY